MQNVTLDRVLREAVQRGIVSPEEVVDAATWLHLYDVALDGRFDGGFTKQQIGSELGMTLQTPLARHAETAQALHRLIGNLFCDEAPMVASRILRTQTRGSVARERSPLIELGANILLLPLLPFSLPGCSDDEPVLDCTGCLYKLCYEAEVTQYPDAGPDAAIDYDAGVKVKEKVCGCPPETHLDMCSGPEINSPQEHCCKPDHPTDNPM